MRVLRCRVFNLERLLVAHDIGLVDHFMGAPFVSQATCLVRPPFEDDLIGF